MLYVRPDAVFNKSKPISGGVPHCFPQVRLAIVCLWGAQQHLFFLQKC